MTSKKGSILYFYSQEPDFRQNPANVKSRFNNSKAG